MKLADIKTAIVARLQSQIPGVNIPAMEVKQGFKKPAFFVEIVPISKVNQSPGQFTRSVTVIIHYFSVNETHIENLEMQDQLEEAFDLILTVGDRWLIIDHIESEIVDKVLHFKMDLTYTDSRDEEPGEFMQNLNLEGY